MSVRSGSAAVSVALLLGCARTPPPARAASVFLVSIDTLRSDHVPAYGYRGVETPALDALRRDAVLFTRAYSHVPLTLPSHATVMTGLLPAAHGIHDNLGYSLAARVPTLAEALHARGWATGAAVSSIVLSSASGVARGFDLWDDAIEPREAGQPIGRVQRSGAETEALLETWLGSIGTRPALGFLHLYEPHTPYEPPEPFRSRFRDPYDGEIAAADAVVGRFVDFLKRHGRYDDALVIVFSDHGEGLGEHGEDEHGLFLYREALQVPLLVKLPRGRHAGASVAAPVGLADLFGTVADVADLTSAGPFSHPAGSVSLAGLADGAPVPDRRLFAETFFPQLHFGWAPAASALDGRWHEVDGPEPEVYDLAADPGERHDLAPSRPDALRRLHAELEARRTALPAPSAIDEEAARRLASLGYLSAGVPAAAGGPLPAARTRAGLVRELKRGSGLLRDGRAAEAEIVFRALLEENPRMLDVWDLESQCLVRMGRPTEALAALKKGITLSPSGSTHYLVAVANLAFRAGRWDEARAHAELARERGDPAADDVLARVHLAAGRLDDAEAAARASLARRSRRLPRLVLARIAVARGRLDESLRLLDEVAVLSARPGAPPVSGYHALRGDVLARLGRAAEAEPELRAELRDFPDDVEAKAALALLYASEGRESEVRAVVDQMTGGGSLPESWLAAARVLDVVGDPGGAEALRRRGLKRFPAERRFDATRDTRPGGGLS